MFDITIWGWVILVITHLYVFSVGFVFALHGSYGSDLLKSFIMALIWPIDALVHWLWGR
jgi:hypothetical protein